jgi:hypothetical protein
MEEIALKFKKKEKQLKNKSILIIFGVAAFLKRLTKKF